MIDAARAGSSSALGELLEGYRQHLLLVANRALSADLRLKASASDLVQDTFCDVHRAMGAFRGSTEGELLAWLQSIMEHRLIHHARLYRHTQKRDVARELSLHAGEVAEELVDSAQTPGAQLVKEEEERKLQRALAKLPEGLRQVLMLRNWHQKSFQEIGSVLEISPDAARKQWGRAIRRLGRELRDT